MQGWNLLALPACIQHNTHTSLENCTPWAQVHIKVALGSAIQGVSGLEAAMELAEYIGTCTSLHLRGISAEHAEPKVVPPTLNHAIHGVFSPVPSDVSLTAVMMCSYQACKNHRPGPC